MKLKSLKPVDIDWIKNQINTEESPINTDNRVNQNYYSVYPSLTVLIRILIKGGV
jgi:hypothetical protein